MLNIKILGTGCSNCDALEKITAACLEFLLLEIPNLEATIQHVQDPKKIQNYPLLFTPGLVLNEKLVCAGRIPSSHEVIEWMRTALNEYV